MPRRREILLFGLTLVLGGGLGASLLRAQAPVAGAPLSPEEDALIDEQIGQQCTKCHVRPPAEYVSRAQWRFRVQEMAERSMTGTGIPPGEKSLLWQLDLEKIIRWLESRAPDVLPMPDAWPGDEGGLVFVKHPYNPTGNPPKPVVSNVRFFDLDADGQTEIVACDMGRGSVFLGEPARAPGVLTQIAILSNPAHAEMVDLDQDGRRDLLIADLGEFLPSDHEKGSVAWMRQIAPLQFEKRVLIDHLPRSADARAADFDGDGDLDLVVAAYGWRKAGSTIYYENETTDWSEPRFVPYTIDARPGPIHVPLVDLNGDGRLDFVVLVSQQYEHLVAYLARPRGAGFRQETIFRAITPVWGSTGIEVVDFDGDGDAGRPHDQRRLPRRLHHPALPRHPPLREPGGVPLRPARPRGHARRPPGADRGHGRRRRPRHRGLRVPPRERPPAVPEPRPAGERGPAHRGRVDRAGRPGGVPAPRAQERRPEPRHPGPRRLRRRRRRRHRPRQLRGLHLREDGHRLHHRHLGRGLGEPDAAARGQPRPRVADHPIRSYSGAASTRRKPSKSTFSSADGPVTVPSSTSWT